MKYVRLFVLAVIALTYYTIPSYAKSDLQEERLSFANSFANIVLSVISDNKKTIEDRNTNLANAFSKSVDIEWIAKFVIGRKWNSISEDKRALYTELYRKFLTKTYVENFAQNPDTRISSIKVVNVSNTDSSDFTVTTEIKLTNQDIMNVNYLVRDTNKKYKVLDIAIENVSLINSHRAEFGKLVSSHGIDGVIEKLSHLLSKKTSVTTLSMK